MERFQDLYADSYNLDQRATVHALFNPFLFLSEFIL